MCSHYETVNDLQSLKSHFTVAEVPEIGRLDLWPGYLGPFIKNQESSSEGARHALLGSFGLVPHWASDTKIARNTYNARSETVADKPSYRDAWRLGRRCIIPAGAVYEPDWRSGKAVAARISRVDGKPMGIAGLWSVWKDAKGDILHSYTMLTINADDHPLMNQFHKPADEKRMVVILPENEYGNWLCSDTNGGRAFLQAYPAELLTSESKLANGNKVA
ncbi:MAG: SOS response-associated peptidase [Gallionella sp.]|nr:SOS response-associated peptidase [Gallionella sp.]